MAGWRPSGCVQRARVGGLAAVRIAQRSRGRQPTKPQATNDALGGGGGGEVGNRRRLPGDRPRKCHRVRRDAAVSTAEWRDPVSRRRAVTARDRDDLPRAPPPGRRRSGRCARHHGRPDRHAQLPSDGQHRVDQLHPRHLPEGAVAIEHEPCWRRSRGRGGTRVRIATRDLVEVLRHPHHAMRMEPHRARLEQVSHHDPGVVGRCPHALQERRSQLPWVRRRPRMRLNGSAHAAASPARRSRPFRPPVSPQCVERVIDPRQGPARDGWQPDCPFVASETMCSRSSRRPERTPIVSSPRASGARLRCSTGPYPAATYTPRGPSTSSAHGRISGAPAASITTCGRPRTCPIDSTTRCPRSVNACAGARSSARRRPRSPGRAAAPRTGSRSARRRRPR